MGIRAMVGSAITDPVLRKAGSTTTKGIDGYELHELVTAAERGAVRPPTKDILSLFVETVSFPFDFRRSIQQNMETLRTKVTRVASFGVTVDATHLSLIILANVEMAAKTEWGRDFRAALQTIRTAYTYSHRHDDDSITAILGHLATADGAREPRDAPAPDADAANSVAESVSVLSRWLQVDEADSDFDDSTMGTAAAVSSSDKDSVETKYPRKKKSAKKSKKKSGGRGGRTRERDSADRRGRRSQSRGARWQDNPCKHCRRYKRHKQHPEISRSRCFWNKDYKGWRQEYVCREMEIKYVPRYKFNSNGETMDFE